MRAFVAFFGILILLGCNSQEEVEQLKKENFRLKEKLKMTEKKLKEAYQFSLKSRLPGFIWIEGNSEVKVNQRYIQSIKFNIFGVPQPTFIAKYFAQTELRPKYYLHFYNRFGKCVGYYRCSWSFRKLTENESREDKVRTIDGLLGAPVFFTITFLE